MNVASLVLCKELYELSGWGEKWESTDNIYAWLTHTPVDKSRESYEGYTLIRRERIKSLESVKYIPAYDLGYLLRKLPAFVQIYKDSHSGYRAALSLGTGNPKRYANNPEDAAAQLAIKLFKQEVLQPEAGDAAS